MTNIESTRSKFFPGTKTNVSGSNAAKINALKRNDATRTTELNDMAKRDTNVAIPEAIKDFSRIRKAVDAAPEVDNSEKIARLKAQVQNGTYNVNYEALADKILSEEL
ncbi:flagellar biosynthesis anti-sigma factor FlgM [Halobacteriovorax sp. HLS]|uniref:flagellar biosynthesis anti-sigma factor FlgM n=1 Tax=Halobacteriovorax sp. HLS TaxID=2234000 RepID=UPI000FD8AA0E|nr:flagellar biosynthesis anti-sigma factor FlgM [Halobacteriovorax sp. HLS]